MAGRAGGVVLSVIAAPARQGMAILRLYVR